MLLSLVRRNVQPQAFAAISGNQAVEGVQAEAHRAAAIRADLGHQVGGGEHSHGGDDDKCETSDAHARSVGHDCLLRGTHDEVGRYFEDRNRAVQSGHPSRDCRSRLR